jgi:hypothetical protein
MNYTKAMMDVIQSEIHPLLAEITHLKLALRKYGRHLDYCHLRHGDDCTCGLKEEYDRE